MYNKNSSASLPFLSPNVNFFVPCPFDINLTNRVPTYIYKKKHSTKQYDPVLGVNGKALLNAISKMCTFKKYLKKRRLQLCFMINTCKFDVNLKTMRNIIQ